MIRKALAPFALLALLLLIAGCGGGGSSTGSSAEVISPKGAPYGYTVPSGFEEVPGDFPEGETPNFLTLVIPEGIEGNGYLNAFEMTLEADEKSLPEAKLLGPIDEQTQTFYTSEGATVTPGKDETIAGHKAVCWQIANFKNPSEGTLDADSCAIASGHTVVNQTCTWKPSTRAAIETGCEELRDSLKIR